MKRITSLPFVLGMVAGVVVALAQTSTGTDVKSASQSARDVRGASPYLEIDKEPAPKLIIDAPLPEGLAHAAGVFWAQYRVENVRILPVFGEGALKASPYWASAYHCRRLALVVGGCKRQQHSRHSRAAARPAQSEDRVG